MPKTPNKPKATDWECVKREAAQDAVIAHTASDGPYDPNDTDAVAAYWKQASIKRGRGRPVAAVKRPTLNMRVDADVLEAFKATGQGWQTRINAALREAVAHGLTKV
ncbi:BrnA antitoxin family protein [Limnohabitans sp.]|uniref:BrnA antitoxin family protein n=1 Tax=Limnohabitans sp. TaxID=1907725 RepID=UPI0025B7AB87|nr:BrnA antitoxin family protein [Limnohabitans sp.]